MPLFRGALMDDAMMLSCGHTFGSIGMQHVYKMVRFVHVYLVYSLILTLSIIIFLFVRHIEPFLPLLHANMLGLMLLRKISL